MISSLDNKLLKKAVRLRTKSAARKETGQFFVDGVREVKIALEAGLTAESIFFCESLAKEKVSHPSLTLLSEEAFKKISFKENPDGVAAIFNAPKNSLDSLKLSTNPLVVVLESLEKPGNLGAIIRSAYAAQVEAVIVNCPQTDIYNPNVIRASEGLVFNLPVITADVTDTIAFLRNRALKICAASLKGAKVYTGLDYREGTAFVLGTEATGLSGEWTAAADEVIKIPMQAGLDSLNVSVAAAILLFEAQRQRGFV